MPNPTPAAEGVKALMAKIRSYGNNRAAVQYDTLTDDQKAEARARAEAGFSEIRTALESLSGGPVANKEALGAWFNKLPGESLGKEHFDELLRILSGGAQPVGIVDDSYGSGIRWLGATPPDGARLYAHPPLSAGEAVAQPVGAGWRPIEAASKDGTRYLAGSVYSDHVEIMNEPPGCHAGNWTFIDGEWRGSASGFAPTHFMPCPARPRAPNAPVGDNKE